MRRTVLRITIALGLALIGLLLWAPRANAQCVNGRCYLRPRSSVVVRPQATITPRPKARVVQYTQPEQQQTYQIYQPGPVCFAPLRNAWRVLRGKPRLRRYYPATVPQTITGAPQAGY